MTELEKLDKASPRGRIDVALFRIGDAIGRRSWPRMWPELRGYWAELVAALYPAPKRRRRRVG